MKKLLRLTAILAVMALVLAACGDDDDAAEGADTTTATEDEVDTGELNLVNDGTLTVCTDVPYVPMEFEDPSTESGYNGFDIQLIGAIAEELGLDLAVVTPGFDAITSGLAMEAGDCDLSAASITITEEREENVDFSDPYFEADQSLLVEEGSGFGSLDDLSAVAVQTGTTGEVWVQDNAPEGVEIRSFEGAGDPYLALQADEVGGVVADVVANQGYADENEGFSVVETYDTDEEYGFAVQEEGSEPLLEAVNSALAQLRDGGTYDQIFSEFFPET